ncbi:MAG: glutaredoxin family protein [Bacillota bacterium]|nr:glutaredoxin family protein [Bacillota bacterium]
MAKSYLAEQGVPFREVDVSQDRANAEELYRISGQLAVPVITVDGEVIVGFNQERLGQLIGVRG